MGLLRVCLVLASRERSFRGQTTARQPGPDRPGYIVAHKNKEFLSAAHVRHRGLVGILSSPLMGCRKCAEALRPWPFRVYTGLASVPHPPPRKVKNSAFARIGRVQDKREIFVPVRCRTPPGVDGGFAMPKAYRQEYPHGRKKRKIGWKNGQLLHTAALRLSRSPRGQGVPLERESLTAASRWPICALRRRRVSVPLPGKQDTGKGRDSHSSRPALL